MAEALSYNDLAKRYGLEAIPESVQRLTKLVANQDAGIEELAKVIAQDKDLTARLLRAANPRADDASDYNITTPEEALMRTGVGCAMLLAMSAPLTMAINKTFLTMLSLKLEAVLPAHLAPFSDEHILCTIGFSGKAEGEVFLRFNVEQARRIAGQILGVDPAELGGDDVLHDVLGELLNMATGNLKSNLCDAGLQCKLTPPTVTRTTEFAVKAIPGGGVERMAFRAGEVSLFVDIGVNPWNRD